MKPFEKGILNFHKTNKWIFWIIMGATFIIAVLLCFIFGQTFYNYNNAPKDKFDSSYFNIEISFFLFLLFLIGISFLFNYLNCYFKKSSGKDLYNDLYNIIHDDKKIWDKLNDIIILIDGLKNFETQFNDKISEYDEKFLEPINKIAELTKITKDKSEKKELNRNLTLLKVIYDNAKDEIKKLGIKKGQFEKSIDRIKDLKTEIETIYNKLSELLSNSNLKQNNEEIKLICDKQNEIQINIKLK